MCGMCLLSFSVGVHIAAAAEPEASVLKVIGEYRTPGEAERSRSALAAQGRDVEVRPVRTTVHLQRLEIGVLPNLQEARAVVDRLKEHRIDSLVRRLPSASGYIVSLGAFSNPSLLSRLRSRVESLGFTNLRVIPVDLVQPRYQVVEKSSAPALRRVIQSSGGTQVVQSFKPEPSPKANTRTGESRRFDSRRQADDYVERLRKRGFASRIDVTFIPREYNGVQLRVYKAWADAQRELPRLRKLGLEPIIITDSRERGYAISVGLYTDPAHIIRLTKRLSQAGYRNVYVLPVTARKPYYRVVALGPLPVQSMQAKSATRGVTTPAASAAGAEKDQPTVLVFGQPSKVDSLGYEAAEKPKQEFGMNYGLRDIRLEYGALTHSKQAGVDSSNFFSTTAFLNWKPNARWEWQLEGNINGYQQTGETKFNHLFLEPGETYVRYRGDKVRLTLGSQEVIWGRIDEIPPTDRLSRHDLRRYFLDDLSDRRLPVPAVRSEWFSGPYKLDVLVKPKFYGAKLPDTDSIWSPIDKKSGQLIGVESTPLLAALIQNGSFYDDVEGKGGGGIRFSKTGRGIDYAITVQRTRHSTPYYELNPDVRAALLAGAPPALAIASTSAPTFTGRHPWTWVVGGGTGMVVGGTTWRFELAWLSDVPVTTTDFRYKTVKGVDWATGIEFFPGGGNARVNLQLAGHHLLDAKDVLDNQSTYLLNGAIEDVFSHGRWRTRLRFTTGLEQKDYYLNPEIAFLGWEPSELYLGYHYFSGVAGTFGGFHENHDMLTLGWRTSF